MAYVHLKEQLTAIEDFTAAVNIDSNHADAFNNRAAALLELGRFEQALSDADTAIGLRPGFASPYAIRALANISLGRSKDAEVNAEKAQELGFDRQMLRHFMSQAGGGRRLL